MTEPPAVVIYMIDPFSYGVDNMELQRLSSMAMIRCFSDIMHDTRIPDNIRQSVYLQTVSLETVYSIAGNDPTQSLTNFPTIITPGTSKPGGHVSGVCTRAPHVSRSVHVCKQLCMSVYSQAMRPNNFNITTKTLTGFGPAAQQERYLKSVDAKVRFLVICQEV